MVPQGATCVHAVPEPVGATYATSDPSLHDPSGRHTSDVHCECAVHAWQASSLPQIGVVPVHALASAVVHCTHVRVAITHTAVGTAQS
jgi:hypothetical protein